MNSTMTSNRETATPRLVPLTTKELAMAGGTAGTGGVEMSIGILLTALGLPELGIPVFTMGVGEETLIATKATTAP